MDNAYSLSPMQEGMLFHSLCAPHAGREIEQLICDLREKLESRNLRRACERVVERHEVLRTRFRWEGLAKPLQFVEEHVALPWAEQDWSDLPTGQQEEAFAGFLRTDRARGFDPAHAPLFRLTLFRFGAARFRFVWTFHHALLDGRSFPIVLREILALYEASQRGESLELAKPRPYREHIEWLQGQDFTKSGDFWKERLKGFAAPTPLVASVGAHSTHAANPETGDSDASSVRAERRAPAAGFPGEQELRLSATETSALQTFAREHAPTLNTLIQGVWAVALSRYTGEQDVVFGATRACRRSSVEGAESMVGLFINTLPVRATVSPDAQLLPWLRDLRSYWTALRDHEHTPLVQVQGWSEVPPATPIFESIVVFESSRLDESLAGQGGAWRQRKFRLIEQPGYPLVLAAYGGEQLCLKIEYDSRRFDGAMVERMLGHLKILLGAMAANPHRRLGDLPMLTAAERHEVLIERNRPRLQFSPGACLHELFEAQAQQTPDAVAVVCEGQRLTYGELNSRADQLARRFRERGVGAEAFVAICAERSMDLVIGILGILKAGGCYVPLDPTHPKERLEFLLKDSRAAVLLTTPSFREKLDGACRNLEVLCADEPVDAVARTPNPEIRNPKPSNLAYVIYTSGSTGKPKGVMVTHHNVVRLFQATEDWFHFGRDDVWTLFHSAAFDFSVWEMWGALLHGGRLVIVPHLTSRSPETFLGLLAREGVTVLNQTPSAFRQLVEADQRSLLSQSLALRLVIFGGEALDPRSLKPWFDRHGDLTPQLVNMYGITETTVHVTYRPLTKADLDAGSVIGVPIPDLEVCILDPQRQPVPIGVAGEIYVGGAGLARGYLNQPALTAERFVPHPFSSEPGARLYRSGDRGRFLPGRDIEYLGRVDDQIKIRGFRVEPGEVESVLLQHPAVRQAVVVPREGKPGDKRLVAYLVAVPTPRADELRDFLKDRLPDYMLPGAVVYLDKLPLTGNGKIDRRALPPPALDRLEPDSNSAPPRTHLERSIAAIWEELLGVQKVGLHDNFFDMGGHSLLLVQLHYRLQAALNRDVAITALFQHPTLSALARHLSEESAPPEKIHERIRRMRELQTA